MTVQPRYPAQRGVAYCTLVMKNLEDALAQVDLDRLGVTVGITGTYAFTASTNAVVNADMLRTTIISSIGVVLIFFVAFGSIFYSIIALIPLLISVVLTMAWAKLTMGGFNLITSFLPALVLGLGIDYGIHLISRYAEERSKGISLNRALHTAVLSKGEASLVAAMTTALVFVGLLFARSRALFEMGAITSMGVILAFLTTLFLIPALVTLSHFIFRAHTRERVVNYATHLSGYFRFVTAKGRVIFVIVLTLTFFVAFQAAHTSFQFSSKDLIPRVKSQEVLGDILAHFGASSAQIGEYFIFFASSEGELTRVVEHLEGSDFVQGVESARDLLPVNLSEQQQVLNSLNIASYIDQLDLLNRSLTERASVLAQIRTLLTQFGLLQYAAALNGRTEITLASNEIQRQLRETQNALNRLKLEESQARISVLQEALRELDHNLLQIRELPPIETLLRDILKGLPEGIRNRYITPDDKYIIRTQMSPQLLQGKNLQKFNTFAASFSDNYFGMPLVGEKLESYMKRDFLISTLLAA
ncbi:MMPL family transporter, partial [Candidatus Bipolaricaulota bacterium]|nr:MMPL family transporter [Candidatus Bipolaricaulota bacterium]